jgi:hypothetical protein
MPTDDDSSTGPRTWRHDLPPALAGAIREGERLAATPPGQRDLAWHVKAFYIGDLGALACAVLRTPSSPPAPV